MMTEEGVDTLVSVLLGSIEHRGIFMSNLDEHETMSILEEILDDIATILFVKNSDFEIKSQSDMTVIMNTMRSNMFATFKRPFKEGERNFFKKITVEKHTTDNRNRGGLFGIGKTLGLGQ
jgi:hypothetical protein